MIPGGLGTCVALCHGTSRFSQRVPGDNCHWGEYLVTPGLSAATQVYDLHSRWPPSSRFSRIWVANTIRCSPAGEGWSPSHLLNFQDPRGHSQPLPGGQLTIMGVAAFLSLPPPTSVVRPSMDVSQGEGRSIQAAPVPQLAMQVGTSS